MPFNIPLKDFPLIVFADHSYGWIEFLIKLRTRGMYNHVMWAVFPDEFATQGGTYSKQPFKAYMKPGNRLKFVQIVGLTDEQARLIRMSIDKKLARPWIKKRYDVLGILGQLIGVKKVNNPWTDYCSEDIVSHLLPIVATFKKEEKLRQILFEMPTHGSPQDLNEYLKKFPEFFKTHTRWEWDTDA